MSENPNTVPIVVQIWTGVSQFVDNRLLIANQSIPQVVYPTYPKANTAAAVNFVKVSGSQFADINGNLSDSYFIVAVVLLNINEGA